MKACLSKPCFPQVVYDVCHTLVANKDHLESYNVQKNYVKKDKALQVIFRTMIILKI
jgi:hypothetical protein